MSGCSYLYDVLGLRWEEGSVLVTLTVDGSPRVFSVVRSGKGASRIERFDDRTHPLDQPDRKVFGEVSVRDLERLAAGGSVVFMRDGRRSSISGSLRAGRFPAEVCVDVDGAQRRFPIEVDPARTQGTEGRLLDEAGLAAFLAGLTREERAQVALAQVGTMPKSGHAGGPAARRRLQVLARELSPSVLAASFREHPDALLHVTPQLLRNVLDQCLYAGDAGDDAQRRSFTALLDDAVTAPAGLGSEGANTVLASLFVLKTEGGAQPDLLPVEVEDLRGTLVARLAAELVSMCSGTLALEVLASNQLVQQECVGVLRASLAQASSKVLTDEFALFLSRMERVHQSTAMLDFLVEDHPAQVFAAEGFFTALPVTARLELIRREPRLALVHVDLDPTSEDLARAELLRRNERVPSTRAEERRRRLRVDADDILKAVDDLSARAAEFDRAFADRLRRLRLAELSDLERDRLMVYGGLSTELREFRWTFERRLQDTSSRLDMLAFDVDHVAARSGASRPSAAIGAIEMARTALGELRVGVAGTLGQLDELRRAGALGDVRDFASRAEGVLAGLPVLVHRQLLVLREAVVVFSASAR
jgi:hypothetical protein